MSMWGLCNQASKFPAAWALRASWQQTASAAAVQVELCATVNAGEFKSMTGMCLFECESHFGGWTS